MDYTLSDSYVTDAGTTNRMHLEAQAVPTAVSDGDMNMVIWEMMEVLKAGGVAGAPFDKMVPATYQKLLLALRSAGVFQTPAQFDTTTKAATTAFIKSSGVGYSAVLNLNASRALTAADIGALILNNANNVLTVGPMAGVRSGDSFTVVNYSSYTCSVAFAGGASYTYGATALTASIPVLPGESITFTSNGADAWFVVSSNASLQNTGSFSGLLAGNGYKKLPGGLILQWGAITTSATVDTVLTYPITFPNTIYSGSLTPNSVGSAGSFGTFNGVSLGAGSVNAWSAATTRVVSQCSFLVLGK